jgi:uroporphyrin-III C-methyltransferase/precorrin-2 dehydrogenase/sirohydrochlorin ferrochelatase
MSSSSIAHFPLFLDLHDVPVLLVGAGEIGQRKLELLLRCGAQVTVVDPMPAAQINERLQGTRSVLRAIAFEASMVIGMRLVIAATDDSGLNAEVAEAAKAAGVWVNAVDQPELGNAIVPAIVSRGPITVGISSSGVAPVLARRLRAQLESLLEPSLAELAELLKQWRPRIRNAIAEPARRRAFYDRLLDGPLSPLLRCAQHAAAEALITRELEDESKAPLAAGRVILLGAGPGDADLMTLAGLRHLQRADVIVHDRLVSNDVLDLARRDAQRIAVGKTGGAQSTCQFSINNTLVALAQSGKYVVRLKGGDPLVFARGGEELAVLREHGIAFEIVPGITAAQGCAAYAGIALTHRDHAQGIRLVTAHCQGLINKLDWQALTRGGETLVFYMAIAQAEQVQSHLLQGGLAIDTPFAVVQNGTRRQQRVLNGRLDELSRVVRESRVESPALLIVGAVTAPALRAHWFGEAAAPIQNMRPAQVKEVAVA